MLSRLYIFLAFPVTAVFLLLAGCTTIEAPAANEQLVAFHFNWPTGLSGEVDISSSRFTAMRGAEKVLRSQAMWDFSVEELEDGNKRIIHTMVGEPVLAAGANEPSLSALQTVFQIGAPNIVVNSEGGFLFASGFDELSNALFAGIRNAEEMPRNFGDIIEQVFSQENYNDAAERMWNSMVSSWLALTMVPNRAYVADTREPLPLPGNPMLNYSTELAVSEPAPCPRALERQCVTISTVATPDRDEIKNILSGLSNQLMDAAGAGRRMKIADYSLVTTMRIVTEPATLIPHRVAMEKEITMRFERPNGEQSLRFRESQAQQWVFSY